MRHILLTGAAGNIGSAIRDMLRQRYALRLSDRTPITDLADDETFVLAELADFDAVAAAVDGVDAIVHLGGIPVEHPFDQILPANIVGAYNLYEAARRKSVRRIVFASTNHVVGFYGRDGVIDDDVTPRPDSYYGASKAYGEALGSLYADKYGAEVMCVRIGAFLDKPLTDRHLAMWVSPRDLFQLIEIGLEHSDLHFEIVYGVSGNPQSWWDNANAIRLGYAAQDNADDYAVEVAERMAANPESAEQRRIQGGAFALAEDWDPLMGAYRQIGKS